MDSESLDMLARFLLTRTVHAPRGATTFRFFFRALTAWGDENGYLRKPNGAEVQRALINADYSLVIDQHDQLVIRGVRLRSGW